MACFLVPTAEAIVATVIRKSAEKKEHSEAEHAESSSAVSSVEKDSKIPFSQKLKWLTNMLWGGAVLLCFEHLWHGEVVPFPPFLTAAADPTDAMEMLHEMATVGVCMAVLITIVWIGMVLISDRIAKRDTQTSTASQEV